MILTKENCYISEKKRGFIIKIEPPPERFSNGNTNYIHCETFKKIDDCIKAREKLIGNKICKDNTEVKKSRTYYRLFVKLTISNYYGHKAKFLTFHSRDLNIIDVMKDWDTFTEND